MGVMFGGAPMCGARAARKLPAMDENTVSIRLELRLTEDVPDGALAVSRTPQKNIEGYRERIDQEQKR